MYRRDAANLGPAHPVEPFALAFFDPPYRMKLAEKALASLRDGGWLVPDALVVVEEAKDAGFVAPEGFAELERRAYDDTEFTFLKFKSVAIARRSSFRRMPRAARARHDPRDVCGQELVTPTSGVMDLVRARSRRWSLARAPE